jgi:hypothetical protein
MANRPRATSSPVPSRIQRIVEQRGRVLGHPPAFIRKTRANPAITRQVTAGQRSVVIAGRWRQYGSRRSNSLLTTP